MALLPPRLLFGLHVCLNLHGDINRLSASTIRNPNFLGFLLAAIGFSSTATLFASLPSLDLISCKLLARFNLQHCSHTLVALFTLEATLFASRRRLTRISHSLITCDIIRVIFLTHLWTCNINPDFADTIARSYLATSLALTNLATLLTARNLLCNFNCYSLASRLATSVATRFSRSH